METVTYKLDVYEGPLDVLLNLITKHKLNIYDIEISQLLEQYMLYIDEAHSQNLELAGEFLEMAARLIYIKTAALLPKPEEAEQLKKELEGELIELSLCRLAAKELEKRNIGNDIFVRRPTIIKADMTYTLSHDPEVLVSAYSAISQEKIKAEMKKSHIESKINAVVKRRIVPVITKVVYVLHKLYSTGEVAMDMLYNGITDRSARVATFLAVLELTRSGRITISDDNSAIYLKEGVKSRWKSKKNSEQ